MAKTSVAKAIAAVLAAPDDISARLVCSDAMMEAGDPRGELIQAQCRLEEAGPAPDWVAEHDGPLLSGVVLDPERHRLKERVADLLAEHEDKWCRDVRPLAACVDDGPRWQFRRGFVDHVALAADTFSEHVSRLRAVTPLVGARVVATAHRDDLQEAEARVLGAAEEMSQLRELRVELDGDGPAFAGMFASDHARGLRSVAADGAGPAAVAAITALPQLEHLQLRRARAEASKPLAAASRRFRSLSLQSVGAACIGALVKGGALDEVEHLDVASNDLDAGALAAVLSRAGAAVRSLRLARNAFGAAGCKALAAAMLPRLQWLDASGVGASVGPLAKPAGLAALRVLFLDENGVGPDTAAAMLAGDGYPALAALSLAQARVGDKGLRALAETRGASRLAALDLSRNKLGEDGLNALGASKHLGELRFLGLRSAGLKGDKVKPLGRAERLELHTLVISHNHLGAKGVKALLDGPGLRGLKQLDLDYNFLGPDSAKTVANAAHLDGLEAINLGWAGIGNRGLSHLAKSPHMAALERLHLINNGLDDDGVRMIVDTWGDNVEVLELGGNTAIGDASATLLAESPKLRRLRRLELGFSAVTAKGIAALRERFGSRVYFWGVFAAKDVP